MRNAWLQSPALTWLNSEQDGQKSHPPMSYNSSLDTKTRLLRPRMASGTSRINSNIQIFRGLVTAPPR
jgi:hypothetical protein